MMNRRLNPSDPERTLETNVSKNETLDEVQAQRRYYNDTAARYESMHVNEEDEHYLALRFLESVIDLYGINTLLDIGAGTGRVGRYFKKKNPRIRVLSIEPVAALREIGHSLGLSSDELVDGDASSLPFKDGEFDLVCEFGVLHHVRTPSLVVEEMMRVGKVGIFISDSNNFGHGSPIARATKQMLNALGLWGVVNFIKTKGKGYTLSQGDGIAYSYSVFNNYKQIAAKCHTHILNTTPAGTNAYKSSPHVALLGIKKSVQSRTGCGQ